MENCLNKYFADEFTSDEKTEFLIEVENNERLKEEFIENQNLLALVDWISPEYENNKEVVQHKL
ncbi:anti-sigma factor, partial [Bacteroides ovatus]